MSVMMLISKKLEDEIYKSEQKNFELTRKIIDARETYNKRYDKYLFSKSRHG